MHRPQPRFAYVLSSMTFLALMSWMSVRAYDNMIGRIYYGPLKGFFVNVFHIGAEDPKGAFRTKAAIFYSNATAGSFKDSETYDALIENWRKTLDAERITNAVLDDNALTLEALRSYNVLILPFATHLSDGETTVIKTFVSQEGHGLIFSGAAGSSRENGDWREISLAAEIIGADNIQELATRGAATLVIDGRNSLSANIPPGLRMSVNTYDRPVSASILEPRTEAAGYWVNVDSAAPNEMSGKRTGIASGSYRGGRFVWTGFTLGSTIDPFGLKAGEILMRNMLTYAAFKPLFAKESWPNGKQAAVAFAADTDDAVESSTATIALFAQNHMPCTFFCTPAMAGKDTASFKAIAANPQFEIGQRGTPDAQGRTEEMQRDILSHAKTTLETLSGRTVVGYSPFEALYDNTTLKALLESKYTYLAGDALNGEPPAVLQARKPRLLRIGRDLNLFLKFPHAPRADEAKTLEQLEREFDAVYRIGGFYNFSFHTQFLRDAGQADVLAKFMDYVKTKNVWLANFSEVAAWSNRWMLVDVDSVNASKVRSNLIVSNNAPGQIDSLRLNVHLADDNETISASSEKLGGDIRVISRQKGNAVLEIRGIRGESLVFSIDRQQ